MDKLLEYFFKEPEREFHVRELAKLVKKSPTTVSKYLKQFEYKKYLLSEKKLNHLLFKANSESSSFKYLKLFSNIKKLHESGLLTSLIEEFNHPKAIILFGSFSKGEDIADSDIDLLIITPIKKEINLLKFEKVLDHKIQLFQYSDKEMGVMKSKNKELINSWINGVVLNGYWELFK